MSDTKVMNSEQILEIVAKECRRVVALEKDYRTLGSNHDRAYMRGNVDALVKLWVMLNPSKSSVTFERSESEVSDE